MKTIDEFYIFMIFLLTCIYFQVKANQMPVGIFLFIVFFLLDFL